MTGQNAIQKLIHSGLTRRQIADSVGATRAAVSHWERSRSIPKGQNLAALVRLAASRGVVLLASDFGVAVAEGVEGQTENDPDSGRIVPVESA